MEKQTNNKRERQFINLNNINFKTARSQFKYKRSGLKILGCVGLMSLSFIIPDGSLFFVLGVMLLSPIKIKYQLRERKNDLKFNINKRLVLWGLL